MISRTLIATASWLLLSGSATSAQPGPVQPAFAADRLRQVVEALAHDSMGGRPTPSPALERAAGYVASRFRAAGLVPLGDDGEYFARFPMVETTLEPGVAGVEIGTLATWRFGTDFRWGGGGGRDPSGILRGPAVVVTGGVTREGAPALDAKGKVVLYDAPMSRSVFELANAGAVGVVALGRQSDSAWARIWEDPQELKPSAEAAWDVWTARRPTDSTTVRFIPFLQLRAAAFERFLRQAGLERAVLHNADSSAKATPLGVEAVLHFDRRIERVTWPANVVGVLPGSDPVLRHEYVIVTAHVDGLGRAKGAPPGPAGILNGADDNASGVAALIQIAAALGAAPRRPARSVIFAAVSGEEIGLLGSDFLAARPPVPRASLVANVNLDMVGRARGDTVYVTGRGDPVLGPVVARALRRGGARGLVLLGEDALERRFPGQRADERSDHVNFRRRGIPAVHFFTGWHADYHETTDDPERVNYDALGRIAQVAHDIVAAAAARPSSATRGGR